LGLRGIGRGWITCEKGDLVLLGDVGQDVFDVQCHFYVFSRKLL
jgi:hypothetical protein